MKVEISNKSLKFKLPKSVIRFKLGTTSYNPRVITISNKGTLSISTDGSGMFSPLPGFAGTVSTIITYSDRTTETLDITILNEDVTVVVTPTPTPTEPVTTQPTTPSYVWHGRTGNTSEVEFGAGKLMALRSVTALAAINGHLYCSTGLVEGRTSIFKTPVTKPKSRIEVLPTQHNDFVLEISSLHADHSTGIVYAAGFDVYSDTDNNGYSSNINCAVIAINTKDDSEYLFTQGKSFRCTLQDTPYKSGMIITGDPGKKPIGITAYDADSIKVSHKDGTYTVYNKITGAHEGTYIEEKNDPSYIDSETRGSASILMTNKSVTYTNKLGETFTIATAQTSPTVTNNTFIPRDFNTFEQKGSVAIGEDGSVWFADALNNRVLHFSEKASFIESMSYIPMNYNCSVDRNNPTRVFAGPIEYEVNYTDFSWKIVRNWAYDITRGYNSVTGSTFFPSEQLENCMRNVVTVNGETFALIDQFTPMTGYYERRPTLIKLDNLNGIVALKTFDAFASVYIDKNGSIFEWMRALNPGEFGTLYKDGVAVQQVKSELTNALPVSNANFTITDNGELIIFNPHTQYKGPHLSWIKNNSVVYNAMPSVEVADNVRTYPSGDAFAVNPNIQYGGAQSVWSVGNKVFVKYIGEFFGGAGGQTNLFFVYENGKLIFRGGRTNWDGASEPAPAREIAGNAKSGDVVKVGDKFYFWNNCEHSGALQCFEISGI